MWLEVLENRDGRFYVEEILAGPYYSEIGDEWVESISDMMMGDAGLSVAEVVARLERDSAQQET